MGCDLFKKHIRGARLNANCAGVKLNLFIADAARIRLNSDVIITNPPYGLRIASKSATERLYKNFAKNLSNGGWERFVVMTAYGEKLKRYIGIKPMREIRIMYGDLPADILIFRRDI